MENLLDLIIDAQQGSNDAMSSLILQFNNLLLKLSKNNYGYIDEDCYQILAEKFVKAVKQFDINKHN